MEEDCRGDKFDRGSRRQCGARGSAVDSPFVNLLFITQRYMFGICDLFELGLRAEGLPSFSPLPACSHSPTRSIRTYSSLITAPDPCKTPRLRHQAEPQVSLAMPVRLRLARTRLTRNSPTFSLVAIPSTSRATARPLEVLGHYDPKPRLEPAPARSPNGQTRDERVWGARQYADNKTGAGVNERVGHKTVSWNVERVKYWLGQGAQPSESVERLLVRAGLLGECGCERVRA